MDIWGILTFFAILAGVISIQVIAASLYKIAKLLDKKFEQDKK